MTYHPINIAEQAAAELLAGLYCATVRPLGVDAAHIDGSQFAREAREMVRALYPTLAAAGVTGSLESLSEDYKHDRSQDWSEGVPLDSYDGAFGYLTDMRNRIRSGEYGPETLHGKNGAK
ncbi:hypothetical protein [Glycomyces sp. NPDC021274]|uniref:hypothetical protein n=1 Tax=Glycomyces sp. NPDC021274 TaxID=3155120 RepID=UPI0033C915C2